MIALLKQAENDTKLLERSVKFDLSNDYNLNQNIKPSQTLLFGSKYTVRELIYRMIVYSDNNAFTFLTKIVDPVQFDKVYSSLRLLNPRVDKDDEFLSVQTYESFFRILYNASYLNRDASQWALDILSKSEFRTGLVAGIPQTVKVSHKFGEKSDASEGTVQLHDCGIVYYPRHPYLLCVMSKGPNFELLDDVIAEISRITFTEVDNQHRNH
jgi:beta-lactamase class A